MDMPAAELTTRSWEGFRLSPQQERLWARRSGDGGPRTVAGAELAGPLDRAVLLAALGDLTARHEILRTMFRPVLGDGSSALMVISAPAAPALAEIDASGCGPGERAAAIVEHLSLIGKTPLDATAPAPVRFSLIRHSPDLHSLVVAAPRLCLDGPSAAILFKQLAEAYATRSRGTAPSGPSAIQYANFAQWLLDHPLEDRSGNEWQGTVDIPPLRLPLELVSRTQETALLPWTAPDGASAAISDLARRHGVAPRTVLLACWHAALWSVSGRPERVLVGANQPGRAFDELADSLGCFESRAPTLLDITGMSSIDALIRALAAQEGTPSNPEWERQLDLHRIGFTAVELPDTLSAGPVMVSGLWLDAPAEPLKLELIAQTAGSRLGLAIRYETDGIDQAGVAAVAQAMRAAMDTATRDPAAPIDTMALLDEASAARHIAQWNPSPAPLTRPPFWHQAFSDQAARTPDALALSCGERRWSYATVDRFTNRMARILRKRGVSRGSRVGLMVERSDLAIASLIAILKAGGAYVPIDPSLPAHRRTAIIEQSEPVLLVADAASTGEAKAALPHLLIDSERPIIDSEDDSPCDDLCDDGALAYVLFTSGSTGTPKGVAIEHRQLMHYVDGAIDRLGLEAPARSVALGTLATDLGNTAIFPALCTGGSVDVVPVSVSSDAQALVAYLASRPYDVLKITPSYLAALFSIADDPAGLMPRRALVLGGEPLSWGMFRLFRSFATTCGIFNHYGPTETCVGVVAGEIVSDMTANLASTVPLGHPLRHARTYILDARGRPVPLGVVGELWIGGETVASGYLGTAGEANKRFVPDPWCLRPGARMYRSGDLVRQLPDGAIEFLGRADRQVKIRGFRVELGEIEAVLRQHENVTASLVVETGESGDTHLVGYVILADGSAGTAEWLRPYLQERLPDFMIPAHIVALARFPLTSAGKIDFSMLPDPLTIQAAKSGGFIEPRTDTERTVAGIFSTLLFLERVGADDDFFKIGGHSLLATRLLSHLRAAFSVDISLRKVFEDATVEGLSAAIDAGLARKARA